MKKQHRPNANAPTPLDISPARKYPTRDVKLLWGLSAARCAFPQCRTVCVAEATKHDPVSVLGKIAHIVAHADRGPRANPAMSVEDRDRYENWVLLCAHHHDLVDVQPNTYSVSDLITWKAQHEVWVRNRLAAEMPDVGFAELEIAVRAILNAPADAASTFVITNPAEKMAKNGLTDRIHFELTMGLGKAKEVGRFVERMTAVDATFPERLSTGFVTEYRRLQGEGVDGDALFEGLRDFASRASPDFRQKAAALAVLSYLFEKCEVFEP